MTVKQIGEKLLLAFSNLRSIIYLSTKGDEANVALTQLDTAYSELHTAVNADPHVDATTLIKIGAFVDKFDASNDASLDILEGSEIFDNSGIAHNAYSRTIIIHRRNGVDLDGFPKDYIFPLK
jgi:hypothetical protein